MWMDLARYSDTKGYEKDRHQQLHHDQLQLKTRRHFLKNCTTGLGGMWLSSMLGKAWGITEGNRIFRDPTTPLAPVMPHFAPKAKRVIYLHMAGAPSQLELFDYKPELEKLNGKECPKEFLEGKKFTFIQGIPKMLGSQYPFHQAGDGTLTEPAPARRLTPALNANAKMSTNHRRPPPRSQTKRTSRRHTGRLGWRIWSHSYAGKPRRERNDLHRS